MSSSFIHAVAKERISTFEKLSYIPPYNAPRLPNPFICQWALGLFPCLGSCGNKAAMNTGVQTLLRDLISPPCMYTRSRTAGHMAHPVLVSEEF